MQHSNKRKLLSIATGTQLVQYRPGDALNGVLLRFASDWGIGRAMVAKRLAILAASGFDAVLHHDALARLAELRATPNAFAEMCKTMSLIRDSAAAAWGRDLRPTQIAHILNAAADAAERGETIEAATAETAPASHD